MLSLPIFSYSNKGLIFKLLPLIYLQTYKFPANPENRTRLEENVRIWRRRPLSNPAINFLAHDAFHILQLSDHLWASLGVTGSNTVRRLSRAYFQSMLQEHHRSYYRSSGHSSDTKKLPHGVPLEIKFDAKNGFKASYVIAPSNMLAITGPRAGANIDGGGSGLTENGLPGEGMEVDEEDRNRNSGVLRNKPAVNDPSEDPDIRTVLSLFPEKVAQAVLALCHGGGRSSASEVEALLEGDTQDDIEAEEGQIDHMEEVEDNEYSPTEIALPAAVEGGSGQQPNGQISNGVSQAKDPKASPATGVTTADTNGIKATSARVVIKWPIEIVVDPGRPLSVRFADGTESELENCHMSITEALELLKESRQRLGLDFGAPNAAAGPRGLPSKYDNIFSSDNRAGIPSTLHRISAMRGRQGEFYGLTYRIGRHLEGVGDLIHDVLAQLSSTQPAAAATAAAALGSNFLTEFDGTTTSFSASKHSQDPSTTSLLLLGPPGTGKSTLLRDVARILANTFQKRVVVVDTSNEIAGEGGIPHACIGRARRMMVPERDRQHEVMREAVQNHNPDVIIIDEIGDLREVAAAKTIAQRGVVLVGTAHGTSLETLLKNPELNPLVGGIQPVILGDAAARSTNAGNKTRLERKGAPTFSTLVELLGPSKWRIHWNVAKSVDCLLAGKKPETQLRWVALDGRHMAQLDGGLPHTADLGGLKAAQVALKAVAAQAGVDGVESSAWIADLALLASRY